ncbi:hypothetical protein Nepgr_021986 [Nepenthes gracilis]|uniref:Receptor-like serine/threonine-protein kinase n=1 Tax=Nepenthes gracilis TaxID=150966 RepID=A0AAD3XXQ8_NEPGR|nr:hypothetical protein Nepgr_021986 [Nepenthes gracilis]
MLPDRIYFYTSRMLPCMFMGSLLFSFAVSQIPLGSKLSVMENNFWASSNGDFALGFFNHSDQSNQRSIGIRFNSNSIAVEERSVVWVAGGDVTVGNESYFQLSSDGELVLFDSCSGTFVWASKTSHLYVTSAVLHDNGNLVLLNGNHFIVWQSFDTPSDTLLPGQHLSVHQMLRAASRNSMSSYYSLQLSEMGQLRLIWESNVTYWTSGSPFRRNLTAVLRLNGAMELVDEHLRVVWSVLAEDHDDSVSFRFLRLDVDGNLRLYALAGALASWRTVWQAVENQCDVFATCGLHGICVFDDSGFPACHCPFGITTDSNVKCLAPYRQNCDSTITMVTYKHTSLYGIYPPNDSVSLASLQQCKNSCQSDPFCTAVTYLNDGTALCRMKKTQYITGYSDPSLISISFVKMCSDPMAVLPSHAPVSSLLPQPLPASQLKRSYGLGIPSLIGAVFGAVIVFSMVQIVVVFWLYRRRNSIRTKASSAFAGPNSAGLIMLTYAEIKELTGNFEHQIAPCLFKAMLPHNRPVVVKELKTTMHERMFRSLVSVIGSTDHKNLVKVEGYCCEPAHKFLIYEDLKNGLLEKCLQNPKMCKRLTWRRRINLCVGVAKAISYLHTQCREFICHGNLNCGNVALDENFEAKVTEFGLEKVNGEASSDVGAAERDVEDFGKFVLVLISGRRETEDIGEWAYNEWFSGQLRRVVDEIIEGDVDSEELERALRIALWCLQADERMKPSMREVVKVLEGTLTVDPPQLPFARRRYPEEEQPPETVIES